MKKYKKAKELLETKANKKEKKPIYATRKLPIGLVSCMLGLVLFTPNVLADEAKPVAEEEVTATANLDQDGHKENEPANQEANPEVENAPQKEAETPNPVDPPAPANLPAQGEEKREETPQTAEGAALSEEKTTASPTSAPQEEGQKEGQQKAEGQGKSEEKSEESNKSEEKSEAKSEDSKDNNEKADTPQKTEENKDQTTDTKDSEKKDPEAKDEKESNKKTDEEIVDEEIKALSKKYEGVLKDFFTNDELVKDLRAKLLEAKADKSKNYEVEKANLMIEVIANNSPGKLVLMNLRAPQEGTLEAPTINDVFYESTTISGGNVQRERIGNKIVRSTVHVTLTDKDGAEKAQLSVTPTSGTKWSVNLPENIKVAEGDVVTYYQELGGKKSSVKTANAKAGKNTLLKGKLKKPTGEIWIENTSSNLVNEDEQAEAKNLFDNFNREISSSIKTIVFKINSTTSAWYEITYDDKSTYKFDVSAKKTETGDLVEGLDVKQVTETSRGADLESITVADNVIKGKLKGDGPFDNIKVQLRLKLSDNDKPKFCNDKCSPDKNSSDPVDADVNTETGEFSYTIKTTDKIELGNVVGVTVKEKNKFQNCSSKKTVTLAIPSKTEVRDPRKLTDKDKATIDKAIREANTVNGTSKLPNGTGFINDPAFIEFDNEGNVRIISPNEVEVEWDDDYNPVYQKNDDGTYKLQDGKEKNVIKMQVKDLVKNIGPYAPTVNHDEENGAITITPKKDDTDASKIILKYTNVDDEENEKAETLELVKDDKGNWTGPEGFIVEVNNETGAITVKSSGEKIKVKNKTKVSATVTDVGGIDESDTEDKKPKTSDKGNVDVKIMPKTPKIEVNDEDKTITITPFEKEKDRIAKKIDITYTPAGSDTETTVTATRGKDGKWKIDGESDFKVSEDGKSFIIKNDKVKALTKIRAKTNDGDDQGELLTSKEAIDTSLPEAPEVKVNEENGNVTITPQVHDDVKEVEVSYKDPSGANKTVKAKKAEDGTWSITENPDGTNISIDTNGVITIKYEGLKANTKVTAKVGDIRKRKSSDGDDLSLPPAPGVEADNNSGDVTVKPPTEDDVDAKVDGMEITYTPAGESEEKTIKVVKGDDGKWKLDGDPIEGISVDEETGLVSFKKGTAKEESKVSAFSKRGKVKGLEKPEAVVPDKTAPAMPPVKVDEEDGSVKITPPGDKDTTSVEVTYKKADGSQVKIIAKKVGDTWKLTCEDGNEVTNGETIDNSGIITLPKGSYKPGEEVRAVGKDKANNSSEPGKDTPVEVTYDPNGGNGTMTGKILRKDSDYTVLPNKFTAPDDTQEFDTWEVDGKRVAPGAEIKVDDNTVIKALWKKIQVNVTYEPNGGSGEMTEKTQDKGSNYTVLPNGFTAPDDTQEFDTWEVNGEKVAPGAKIKVDKDTVVKALWKKIQVNVTYEPNGGSGEMTEKTQDKGSNYTVLPNGFTAPDDTQEFDTWEVNGEKVAPGAKIKVDKDTVVKAIWKKIQVNVTYDANGGKGTMEGKTVDKGSGYTVLPNTFTAPDDTQEFKAWEVDGKEVAAGTEIEIKGDTVIKAIWKDKTITPENPGTNPDQPGDQTPDQPTPNPGTEPGQTPGEKPVEPETPEDPTKPEGDNPEEPENPNTPDKPSIPDQPSTPATPAKPADGDKKVKKGDKEIVIPKEAFNKDKGKLDIEDRTKIEEKIKEKNPDLVDVKIDEKGNVSLVFKDGKKEEISAEELRDAAGIKIPRKEDQLSSNKKAGKNAKTGIGSVAGVICTLVGSTGALYIGRKKED